jgi:hypothetical protein
LLLLYERDTILESTMDSRLDSESAAAGVDACI